jgi:hypothetical protein
MSRNITLIIMVFLGTLTIHTPLWATDHSGHGPGDMAAPIGVEIATQKVKDYTLNYYLLDLAQREVIMEGMKGMEMPGMSKSPDITNHLVVYILDADNNPVSGKVGFIVTDPSGKEFKTLTMGMGGGYGADVIMKAPGTYKIKTKAVVGDETLMDAFEYSVK